MNYFSEIFMAKIERGWIHLTPASNLKFIEPSSVFIEFCLYGTQCDGELLFFGTFPEGEKRDKRRVLTKPAGEASSCV